MTAEKAPFTICSGFPVSSVAVASDIFLVGSKAANLTSFGASEIAVSISSHHDRALEAGAVQTFAKHLAGRAEVHGRERAGREQAEVDRRDFMGSDVGVGQGMELRNRARPIVARANGTDRQRAAMVRAVALDERATNVGQARHQHFEAVIIPPLGLVVASPAAAIPVLERRPGAGIANAADWCGRAIDLTDGRPAPASDDSAVNDAGGQ